MDIRAELAVSDAIFLKSVKDQWEERNNLFVGKLMRIARESLREWEWELMMDVNRNQELLSLCKRTKIESPDRIVLHSGKISVDLTYLSEEERVFVKDHVWLQGKKNIDNLRTYVKKQLRIRLEGSIRAYRQLVEPKDKIRLLNIKDADENFRRKLPVNNEIKVLMSIASRNADRQSHVTLINEHHEKLSKCLYERIRKGYTHIIVKAIEEYKKLATK